MRFGAGTVVARKRGAAEIVGPRPYAIGSIADTYRTYPATGGRLPARLVAGPAQDVSVPYQ
jgi:predicted GTPase